MRAREIEVGKKYKLKDGKIVEVANVEEYYSASGQTRNRIVYFEGGARCARLVKEVVSEHVAENEQFAGSDGSVIEIIKWIDTRYAFIRVIKDGDHITKDRTSESLKFTVYGGTVKYTPVAKVQTEPCVDAARVGERYVGSDGGVIEIIEWLSKERAIVKLIKEGNYITRSNITSNKFKVLGDTSVKYTKLEAPTPREIWVGENGAEVEVIKWGDTIGKGKEATVKIVKLGRNNISLKVGMILEEFALIGGAVKFNLKSEANDAPANVVRVIRYVRPMTKGKTGKVCPVGNRGVTLVFDINHDTKELKIFHSECVDTFSKKEGFAAALDKEPETIAYNPKYSLVEHAMYLVTKARRRNMPHLRTLKIQLIEAFNTKNLK